VLNSDASPRANQLVRPPRFLEISEEDEVGSDALEDNRCESPTPVTRRKKLRSTSSASQPHVLLRPSSPPPPVPHAPILSTIPVNIDEDRRAIDKQTRNGYRGGSGNPSAGSSSSTSRRATPFASTYPRVWLAIRRNAGVAEEE
jgi:hypothetical protein